MHNKRTRCVPQVPNAGILLTSLPPIFHRVSTEYRPFAKRAREKTFGSLPNAGEKIEHGLVFLLTARFAEDVPKAKGLVARASHDGLSVGRHRQVQNSIRVPGEFGYLGQAGIFPDEDLVLRVSVSAHELGTVLAPREIADLRARVDALHGLARERVPEADATVGCATAGGQESVMMGRPRDGLHRGQVLCVRLHG